MALRASVSPSPGQTVGTSTNDNASAGNVGEYLSATLAAGSAVSLVTATGKTVTSVSLTAGDWDVDGVVDFISGATTNIVVLASGSSSTADTIGADNTYGSIYNAATGIVYGGVTIRTLIPTQRVSIAGTTTFFLIAQATFSVSTLTAHGLIRARRVR